MNLINFYKHPKNEKYIQLNKVYYCSQGAYHSYSVMPFGNGYNKYIVTIENNQKQHKIVIKEKYIIDWIIAVNPFEDPNAKPWDSIEFKALGKLENGQYIELYVHDCDDFTFLNGSLRVIDVDIVNDRLDIPMVCINNENQYCDNIMVPKQHLYYEKLESMVDVSHKVQISYEELFDEKNLGEKLYFVIDDGNKTVIPFEITQFKKFNENTCEINDGCDTMKAHIYYKFMKIPLVNIKLSYCDYDYDDVDDYNIQLDMIIEYSIFDEKFVDVIFDYCYVVK